MADALRANTSVTWFSLRGWCGQPAPHVRVASRCASGALILDTKGNDIHETGATAIGEALRANTAVTNLDLRCEHSTAAAAA